MDFLNSVIKANQEVYAFLKENSKEELTKQISRGFGGDISIGADLGAEKIFIKHLKNFGSILSEEAGFLENGKDIIIIDPIDGSANFKNNIPFYATSVARKKNGVVTDAAVANLVEGTIYLKSKGIFEKRFLFSEKREKITKNEHSTIGIFEKSYSSEKLHAFLKQNYFKYRSFGALALSLALAYEVKFVMFKGVVREFDIAAGWHICEDLFRYKTDSFLLVSKDKEIFVKIHDFIKEQSVNGFF